MGRETTEQVIPISMSQRYSMVGNAVTPAVIKFVSTRLIQY